MKFKLIKEGCDNVGAYGITGLSTGDTLELDGVYAEKATNNPDFEAVNGKKERMTVPKLKRALDAANIEYPFDADIKDLQELYKGL